MRTLSFIGSDKNAGKTTAFNFVMRSLYKRDAAVKICLTSIGLNGETVDNYEGTEKPTIQIIPGNFFVTAAEHLKSLSGNYSIVKIFSPPNFKKVFVLGLAINSFNLILEGPNEKSELLQLKKGLKDFLHFEYLLIDGSIDRQIIAHPEISDDFYFAILISNRREQIKKANDLLLPLSFKQCSKNLHSLIKNESHHRSLFVIDEKIIYKGETIPFMDNDLKHVCENNRHQKAYLYLNGALSKTLFNFLSPFSGLTVILDNFTLYQNISTKGDNVSFGTFHPTLELLNELHIGKIFLKQEVDGLDLKLPKDHPVHNLFREDIDEIRIGA